MKQRRTDTGSNCSYIMIISKSVSFTAVCLRLAFVYCQGTVLYCIMICHFITGKRRHLYLIIYSDNIMIYHLTTGRRRNSYFIKYSDNIVIYHYITGRRRNSYLIKYSDNIMIYHYITGQRRNSYLIKYSDNNAYMIKT